MRSLNSERWWWINPEKNLISGPWCPTSDPPWDVLNKYTAKVWDGGKGAIHCVECDTRPKESSPPTAMDWFSEIQKAFKEISEYDACLTGDCPHEKQAECFEAMFAQGVRWGVVSALKTEAAEAPQEPSISAECYSKIKLQLALGTDDFLQWADDQQVYTWAREARELLREVFRDVAVRVTFTASDESGKEGK